MNTHLKVKRKKFLVQIERDKKWKGYILEVMNQLATYMFAWYNIPPPPLYLQTNNTQAIAAPFNV